MHAIRSVTNAEAGRDGIEPELAGTTAAATGHDGAAGAAMAKVARDRHRPDRRQSVIGAHLVRVLSRGPRAG